MAQTTWDPATKAATSALSNSDRTISDDQSPLWGGAVSTTSRDAGDLYVEVSGMVLGVDVPDATDQLVVGFAVVGAFDPQAQAGLSNIGQYANQWCIYTNGYAYAEGDYVSDWPSCAIFPTDPDDVLMIALSPRRGMVWFGVNGVWGTGDPASGLDPAMTFGADLDLVMGTSICVRGSAARATQFTINFGASAFAHAPPDGFVAWDSADFLPVPVSRRSTVGAYSTRLEKYADDDALYDFDCSAALAEGETIVGAAFTATPVFEAPDDLAGNLVFGAAAVNVVPVVYSDGREVAPGKAVQVRISAGLPVSDTTARAYAVLAEYTTAFGNTLAAKVLMLVKPPVPA